MANVWLDITVLVAAGVKHQQTTLLVKHAQKESTALKAQNRRKTALSGHFQMLPDLKEGTNACHVQKERTAIVRDC